MDQTRRKFLKCAALVLVGVFSLFVVLGRSFLGRPSRLKEVMRYHSHHEAVPDQLLKMKVARERGTTQKCEGCYFFSRVSEGDGKCSAMNHALVSKDGWCTALVVR